MLRPRHSSPQGGRQPSLSFLQQSASGYPPGLFQQRRAHLEEHHMYSLEEETGASWGGPAQVRRLWAVRGHGACSWLTARPSSREDRVYLSPEDARICYRYWLGLPLDHLRILGHQDVYDASPVLRSSWDWAAGHAHRRVQLELASIMEDVGMRYRWEDAEAFAPQGAPDYRRPDIVLPDSDHGTQYAIDVCTIGALRQDVERAGGAVASAEATKGRTYEGCCRRVAGYTALPFGIDSFGSLGQSAQFLIRRLAQRRLQTARRDEDEGAHMRFRHMFTQRVVLSLLRAQSHVLRRACCWGGGRADATIDIDSRHQSRACSADREPAGLANLATMVLHGGEG